MQTSLPRILGAVVVGAVFAFGGFWIGQFAPSGSELAATADPLSQAQTQMAFRYAAIGGVVGALIGYFFNPRSGE
jgi:hypothetical protein